MICNIWKARIQAQAQVRTYVCPSVRSPEGHTSFWAAALKGSMTYGTTQGRSVVRAELVSSEKYKTKSKESAD